MRNYNFLQTHLHHFILKSKNLKKSLFYLENQLFHNKKKIGLNKHIFILGMPRSGTTAFLNFLYETNEFASLTYNDMPFVMSPNFGSIFPKRKFSKIERKHGDGIEIDNFSPEALDEIFFITFEENELREYLENYISLILMKYSKDRYLSKNNNNYKRLNIITSIFPNSNVFILYRDPFQQACSLLEQHVKFSDIQKKEKFVLDYMNYLGHNEFGLNYKTWNKPIKYKDNLSLDHWLEQWFLFYNKILKSIENKRNIFLISYDDLCQDVYLIKKISQISNVKFNTTEYFKIKKKNRNLKFSKDLMIQCNRLNQEMNNSKFNINKINL